MNTKDNFLNDTSFQKLLHNDNYYRQIFKKTEKIVSTVFYILNNIESNKKSETHISNVASKAHLVHEHAIRTLDARPSSATEVLEQFAQALIGLDSSVRVAAATSTVPTSAMNVVVSEIDTVLRGLGSYMATDSSVLNRSLDTTEPKTPRSRVSTSGTNQQSVTERSSSQTTSPSSTSGDRRERIKTILEAKGEASIKDISEIITDCSEKTLQRELNAMIEENLVKRQGERRWSKYSIF